tara:strand:- start:1735 stop:2220 length:486 start_codon:yes stop_codon:yes gene_type:complete
MIKNINLFFLTFFFIGKIKYAPGTIASFFTCALFFLLVNIFNFTVVFFITLIILIYSFIAINSSYEEFNTEDPQEIVIDEVVGQFLVLLAIPIFETLYPLPIIYYFAGSLFFFRLFDILKPYPINYIDDNVSGALGIMLDDIAASIYSILILILIFFFLGG